MSANGVQLEIAQSLRPNVNCELRVRLDGGEVGVRAMVRRCRAIGFGIDENQRRVLLYRAGLEFTDVTPEVQERFVGAVETAALSQTGPDLGHAVAAGSDAPEPAGAGESEVGDGFQAGPTAETPPRRAPRREGPIKIRISADHVRRIIDNGS